MFKQQAYGKVRIIPLISLLMLPAVSTAAEKLGYTWIEADYVNLDIDDLDDDEGIIEDFDDGDGWAARGSFAFTENFFTFASFSDTDSDATFFDNDNFLITANTDIERLNLGIGFNWMLGSSEETQADLVTRIAYTDIDYGDFGLGGSPSDDSLGDLDDDSSDGYYADALLRAQILSWLEGGVGLRYTDIEDIDNVSVIGEALFELTPSWGISLEADVGDELSTYLLGLRYTFDRR